MTASMAGFAVEDVFVKAAATTMPLGQVLLVIGLIGVVTQARSLGREHLVGLTIGSTALTARWAEGRLPKVGDRLPLVLDRHRVHLFAKEA